MVTADPGSDVDFSGSLITGQKLFRELAIILVVALLLLYFILAAQFESLTQPLIVLLEIPIDIAGALLLVKLWGGTINIMTMIGLIVMSGVIINDSILKVDTINNLRREGMGLERGYLHWQVPRGLKPIIMVAMASLDLHCTDTLQSGNRIGASAADGTGTDRRNVAGYSGELVLYTAGVLVYIQK